MRNDLQSIFSLSKLKISNDSISNSAPYRIVNIGNSKPISLSDYIKALEEALGIVSEKNFIKMQEGDILDTFSNINLLETLTGFRPKRELKEGILEFVDWYKSYYLKEK